jgi:nucleoside-diphosphate-sugar epimerase
MKIFITGASGFVGSHLAMTLARSGHEVWILLRDPTRSGAFIESGISVIYGDLSDTEKLRIGMYGCDWVFHLAAFTKPVSKDRDLPYRTNVTGTLNVLEAAKARSVKKVIITSSAGTLSYSRDGLPVTEETNNNQVYHTEYERTKAFSEVAAREYNTANMDVVIVNPSRIYGPGNLTISNSVTRIISLYGRGVWRIIPGNGEAIGNYVYIDDVISGLILAAMHGKGGERYILGGDNLSYNEFFNIIGAVFGRKRKLWMLKEPCLKRIVRIARIYSSITRNPPFISEEWIDKYLHNWILSSNKAQTQLNYKITPFREGAEKTILWLKSNS